MIIFQSFKLCFFYFGFLSFFVVFYYCKLFFFDRVWTKFEVKNSVTCAVSIRFKLLLWIVDMLQLMYNCVRILSAVSFIKKLLFVIKTCSKSRYYGNETSQFILGGGFVTKAEEWRQTIFNSYIPLTLDCSWPTFAYLGLNSYESARYRFIPRCCNWINCEAALELFSIKTKLRLQRFYTWIEF